MPKQVFEPVALHGLTTKNRLVRSATWEGIATPEETGLDLAAFDRVLADGSAREALGRDEALAAAVGVRGLPDCLVKGPRGALLVSPLAGLAALASAIERVRG